MHGCMHVCVHARHTRDTLQESIAGAIEFQGSGRSCSDLKGTLQKVRLTGVCEISAPPAKNTLENIGLKNAKSGAGSEFMLPLCRAEALLKKERLPRRHRYAKSSARRHPRPPGLERCCTLSARTRAAERGRAGRPPSHLGGLLQAPEADKPYNSAADTWGQH